MNRRVFVGAAAGALAAPQALDAGNAAIKLRELYAKVGGVSDLARSMQGKRLSVIGFMAPPLKAESRFFVLTKLPMEVCPFCDNAADWPDNILGVYTKRVVEVIPFNRRIEARGVLELGSYTDPETGFVSLVRLVDATYA